MTQPADRKFRCGVVIVSVLVTIALAMASPSLAGAAQPQLTATGSSLAGVAMTQWEGQFNELYGGNINFTVSSSQIGLNDFAQRTVDFGASDLTYAAAGATPPSVPYQYVPDVGYALAFEYNLIGQDGKRITNLVLNGETIAGIFTGALANWDDPAIAALNPGVRLPHETITPFYRSDPSGDTYVLSDYALQADASLLTDFQTYATVPTPAGQPSATWADFAGGTPPDTKEFPNITSLVGVNGADAAIQGPVHDQGGISYLASPYAKISGLPLAMVVNESGRAVKPTPHHASHALAGATLNSDLTANLLGVFTDASPKAYPVSAYSYLVVPCDPTQAATEIPSSSCSAHNHKTSPIGTAQGAELGQFVAYAVCLGQAKTPDLGYAALPLNLVQDAYQAIGRIPGATEPPPPTPSNCPNPEL
jgi:ABC-type phosphate transport system substrate-binding protein